MKRSLFVPLLLCALGGIGAVLWQTRYPGSVPGFVPMPALPLEPGPPPTIAASTMIWFVETPFDARVFRSRDEVLLMVRRTDTGLPAAGTRVYLLDREGHVLRPGTTDGYGVFRSTIPESCELLRVPQVPRPGVRGGDLDVPIPPPPPPPSAAGPPLLLDRSSARPGDRIRLLARVEGVLEPGAGPTLRLDPADPPLALEPDGTFEPEGDVPGVGPRWRLFTARIPSDARPGTATVALGGGRIEFPVRPRFGAPPPATEANAPPPAGLDDPRLAFLDGEWRLKFLGTDEKTAVLLFARCGDRFLGHATALPEGPGVSLALPGSTGGGEPVRITVVAAGAGGFEEHSEDAPATGAGPILEILPRDPGESRAGAPGSFVAGIRSADGPAPLGAIAFVADDPSGRGEGTAAAAAEAAGSLDLVPGEDAGARLLLRAVAALPGGRVLRAAREADRRVEFPAGALGPRWIRPGDRVEGVPLQPFVRPAAALPARAVLRPGEAIPFPPPGRILPPDAAVRWRVLAPEGAGGPFRIRSGRAIVAESLLVSGVEEGRSGAFLGGDVGAALRIESSAPGLRAVVLEADLPPEESAEGRSEGVEVVRTIPGTGRAGQAVDVVLVLRSAGAPGPVHVTCPLPRGAVPAEDGWAIRDRAPAGTRVEADRDRVAWSLPSLPPGEARLGFRARLAWAGRYAVPSAVAESEDPEGPRGRSGTASLEIR